MTDSTSIPPAAEPQTPEARRALIAQCLDAAAFAQQQAATMAAAGRQDEATAWAITAKQHAQRAHGLQVECAKPA
jgi:hypothetical protein